tara:strand:- start:19 stop:801 length:783 start_codon:yes stop_codon:yes gene_type:complete
LKVLLIGETCVDYYVYGNVKKDYIESKLCNDSTPVFSVVKSEKKMGMASNVFRSIKSLKCDVTFLTNKVPIVKKRFIEITSKKHYLRADFDDECEPLSLKKLKKINLRSFDYVVFSDYNKGLLNEDIITYVVANFKGPIFVDSKKINLKNYNNCVIKINNHEFNKAEIFPDNFKLIVTRGKEGASYEGENFPIYDVDNVIDICGAGDNFLAGLSYLFYHTEDMSASIDFANYCAATCLDTVGVKPFSADDIAYYFKNFLI